LSVPIRITISDDHPIVLAGLRQLIAAEREFELVGETPDGLSAQKLIRQVLPDIAILDISMPELNGIVTARRLADECPQVRLMILTFHEDRSYLKQALDAGVRGYVLKRAAAEHLAHAVRAVMAGGIYVDPAIVHRLFDAGSMGAAISSATGAVPQLTAREAEVLKAVALGFTNKEVARSLDIGVKSVETYKARGLEKLGLKTRAQLVRFAAAQGWLADA
jgi:DNA-binding NarL/FixJ family response regulator